MSPTSSRPGPSRYIEPAAAEPEVVTADAPRNVVVRETRNSKFQQTVSVGPHRLLADEPVAAGGEDSGPGPYDLLLTALGACKSMTMRLYADRKSLPLERATVTLSHSKIHAQDCAECENQGRHARSESTSRSALKARSMPNSASESSRSPTNARCIAR